MYNLLLSYVMDIAEQMLVSGAEIYRVEESVNRIFNSYNAKRVDSFIVTPCIIVTVRDETDNVYTQTRRITSTGTNIEKLHRLNDLSRRICEHKFTLEQIKDELDKISACQGYPMYIKVLSNALIAGSFTLFFGGTLTETIVSLIIGSIMQFTYLVMNKINTNRLFEKLICSLIVSFLAFISVKISIVQSVDKIIIGNIMSMIPGVGFTNALRDLFKGDIFTGVHRMIESLLFSAAISAGYVITAVVFGGFIV